eukprot:GILI01007212.1.p1 GENE.GILI01007212.1~~GILI01007212.1.p1  ORF type:complete len:349 (+),score=32.09 GILI01007212.1:218-1264(+)
MHHNYVYHVPVPVQGAIQYGYPYYQVPPTFIHQPMGVFNSTLVSPPLPKPAFKVSPNSSKESPSMATNIQSTALAEHDPDGSHAFVADKFKTSLCRSFEKGKPCSFGPNCMFAHGPLDKRTVEMNLQDGILTLADAHEFCHKGVVTPATFEYPILAERFKTHFCRSYERKEICPYGHRCIFAHTQEEKRTVEMNVKDCLFTLEAIDAFRRAQPVLTYATSVRVGNGPVVKLTTPVDLRSDQPAEVTLPDPRAFSNSVLAGKKVRGKKKSRKLSKADKSTSSNPSNNTMNSTCSDPQASSMTSISFNSFLPPPRLRSPSPNGHAWEDSISSDDTALFGTVQALIELAKE